MGAQCDTLLIISDCAPKRRIHSGEKISGGGSHDCQLPPGQIEFGGTNYKILPCRSGWTRRFKLPALQKGSRPEKKEIPLLVERKTNGLAAGGSERWPGPGLGLARFCRVRLQRADLRQGQKRDGMNVGDGSSLREGHRDGGGRYFVGELRDNQNIELTNGEEGGLQGSAKFFDGVADRVVAIGGIAKQTLSRVRGVADLVAIKRHGDSAFQG